MRYSKSSYDNTSAILTLINDEGGVIRYVSTPAIKFDEAVYESGDPENRRTFGFIEMGFQGDGPDQGGLRIKGAESSDDFIAPNFVFYPIAGIDNSSYAVTTNAYDYTNNNLVPYSINRNLLSIQDTAFQIRGSGAVIIGSTSLSLPNDGTVRGLLNLFSDSSTAITPTLRRPETTQLAYNVGNADATEIDGGRKGLFTRYIPVTDPRITPSDFPYNGCPAPMYAREDSGILRSGGFLRVVGGDTTNLNGIRNPLIIPSYVGDGYVSVRWFDSREVMSTYFSFSLSDNGGGSRVTLYNTIDITSYEPGWDWHFFSNTDATNPDTGDGSFCIVGIKNYTDSIIDQPYPWLDMDNTAKMNSLVFINNTVRDVYVTYDIRYAEFESAYFGWFYD